MNIALLLAGGIGSRMQSDVPKQYIKVNERMMITYSLETLVNSSLIDRIVIVAEVEWRELILADAGIHGISTEKINSFAIPGFNRQASILNGLQNILYEKNGKVWQEDIGIDDTVMIHDASKPLLKQSEMNECFAMLKNHDGVVSVFPTNDSIYFSEGRALKVSDWKKTFIGHRSEVFHLGKYYQANVSLMPDRLFSVSSSTEPAIVAGMDIVMRLGDKNNFQITNQDDLDRFCHILNKEH